MAARLGGSQPGVGAQLGEASQQRNGPLAQIGVEALVREDRAVRGLDDSAGEDLLDPGGDVVAAAARRLGRSYHPGPVAKESADLRAERFREH